MRSILVATTNPHKLEEIEAILAGVAVELRALSTGLRVPEPPEHGETFAENAREKALYYARATRSVAVAEDSGLEIDVLGGRPGVLSARFNGTSYAEKHLRLFSELEEHGPGPHTARFVSAVALVSEHAVLFEATGVVEGVIAPAPRGTGGFGYDPIFFYPPYGRTLAEVSAAEKRAISHRGRAFRALRAYLEAFDGVTRRS